ncbi:hypothetical protein FF021_12365 [Leptospira noguchii]|nr:hypothetical protein FF021_12365 [Leptospira noguchii]
MDRSNFYIEAVSKNRVVEKLISYQFLFHGNDRSKQFCRSPLWNFSTTLMIFIHSFYSRST